MTSRERVFVCSKFAGDFEHNVAMANKYCAYLAKMGKSPYAPHLINPGFLKVCDETVDPEGNRDLGISIGMDFLSVCDTLWAFFEGNDECWSSGMAKERDFARAYGIPIITTLNAERL